MATGTSCSRCRGHAPQLALTTWLGQNTLGSRQSTDFIAMLAKPEPAASTAAADAMPSQCTAAHVRATPTPADSARPQASGHKLVMACIVACSVALLTLLLTWSRAASQRFDQPATRSAAASGDQFDGIKGSLHGESKNRTHIGRTTTQSRSTSSPNQMPDFDTQAESMTAGHHDAHGTTDRSSHSGGAGARTIPSQNDGNAAAGTDIARVAIVVVGGAVGRNVLHPTVLDSQQLLTAPLDASFGGPAHLYLCVDNETTTRQGFAAFGARKRRFGTLVAQGVFYHEVHSQFQRLHLCLQDVIDRATTLRFWENYTWVVRSRPDAVFYKPVPSLSSLALDTVHTRAFRIHGRVESAPDVLMSPWDQCGDIPCSVLPMPPFCGSNQGAQCVWRDQLNSPQNPMHCVTADDMFAYIPKQYAVFYFGLRKGFARHAAVEVGDKRCCEEGHAESEIPSLRHSIAPKFVKCAFPESVITCRIYLGR